MTDPRHTRHKVIVDDHEYPSLYAACKALKIFGDSSEQEGHKQFRLELKRRKKLTSYDRVWELGEKY